MLFNNTFIESDFFTFLLIFTGILNFLILDSPLQEVLF